LHAGECAAIALSVQRGAERLLCDDSAARMAAESLGLQVRGTIGLIVRALRRRTRTLQEVGELLEKLPASSSLHLSRALLNRIKSQLPSS